MARKYNEVMQLIREFRSAELSVEDIVSAFRTRNDLELAREFAELGSIAETLGADQAKADLMFDASESILREIAAREDIEFPEFLLNGRG